MAFKETSVFINSNTLAFVTMAQNPNPTAKGVLRFIRKRGGISLPVTLAGSISTLVLIAVLSVLGLGIWSGARNTFDLWRDQATFILSTTVDKIRTHLEPSRSQLEFVSQLIESGQINVQDRQSLLDTFTGGLAAAPQINSLLFVDMSYQAIGVARARDETTIFRADLSKDHEVKSAMKAASGSENAKWGAPLWREVPNETLLNLRLAVRKNGAQIGMLIAAVSVRDLSSYLGELGPAVGSNVFILHDQDHVIAHPNLVGRGAARTEQNPLPTLVQTGDPVLAAIWRKEGSYPLDFIKGTELKGHELQLFGDEYFFLYRDLEGFSDKTWQIGTYYRSEDVDAELQRLIWAATAGLVALVLAILAAIWLGRSIARPVVDAADAASRISTLDISNTPELPGSLFRELNDQAQAFNTMLRGLKWFEAYVPKKLVRRLMSQGAGDLPSSIERDMTVMFTDIVGYSGLSEGAPAKDVATFLNRHFGLISTCVENEGGTVDKFIGDGVMAFWGAPDEQLDHAERAVYAAQAIATALHEENKQSEASGDKPVRIRIGLHSGPVTVGNIGAPGRINYTIIGDTVNIAQRIEQLGKDLSLNDHADHATTTIVSADTVAQLPTDIELEALGQHAVRGRQGTIEVYRLK